MSPPSIDQRPPRKARILIVDDSQTVTYVLRTYLMNLNLEFDVASDAASAMRKTLRNPPDIIISDIQMPGMDGIEFFRAMIGMPGLRSTHFLLMSSRWTDERRQQAERMGVKVCLQKPVSADELAQLVTKLLG